MNSPQVEFGQVGFRQMGTRAIKIYNSGSAFFYYNKSRAFIFKYCSIAPIYSIFQSILLYFVKKITKYVAKIQKYSKFCYICCKIIKKSFSFEHNIYFQKQISINLDAAVCKQNSRRSKLKKKRII